MAIVILDANVWIKERLLRSGMGAALLWAVKKTGSSLRLSATTQFEIVNGVQKEIEEIATETEDNLATVRAFIGKSQEITFPSAEEVQSTIDRRLFELGSILTMDNHRSEHLESALQRVLKHLPPAHKKEEFRDCLLWEMSLDTAATTGEEIVLITGDAAFYHKDKYENGIAYPLREDLERTGAKILVYQSLEVYLSTIKEKVSKPDAALVTSAIDKHVYKTVEASLDKSTFSGVELMDSKIDTFLTEVLDEIAIGFRLKYKISELELLEGIVIPEAYGIAEGSATFNSDSNAISNFQMTAYKIESVDGQILRQNGYAYMSGGIGTRYIPYVLRKRI